MQTDSAAHWIAAFGQAGVPCCPIIGCKRLILTHMSDDMLGRLAQLEHETAYDGKVVEF